MTPMPTRYGLMEVIEQDLIVSRSLVMYGEWAEEELKLLAQFIVPGACVLDVGAFIGTHTLAFAQMVGPSGKVYAFEPRREIFAYLQRNIDLNGAAQVCAFNLALGAQPALLTLGRIDLQESHNFGALSLSVPIEASPKERYEIRVVRLDDMDVPSVDLIKLDVEGMESDVLAGAQAIITRDKPVIFAECNSLDGGRQLLDFAKISGYRVFGNLSSAYHTKNFNKVEENIFGAAREVSIVLLHAESTEAFQETLDRTRLPEVESLDGLVCLLLGKPQYFGEVLAPYCDAHQISFSSEYSELAQLRAAKEHSDAALNEVKALALTRLDEISVLADRVAEENAALRTAETLAVQRFDLIGALQTRIELTDVALSEAQKVAFARQDEISALVTRVEAENTALREAEALAAERLDLIGALEARIELTDRALSEAQMLAFSRSDEISALLSNVGAGNTALRAAEAMAFERLDQIRALQARIELTDNALNHARKLAFTRAEEVASLTGSLEACVAALNRVRLEEISVLTAQIEQAQKDRQNLEQTRIIRALRATGLLRVKL